MSAFDSYDRQVGYAMVKFLESKKDLDQDKVAAAVSALSNIFGVDTKSAEDFKDLNYYPSTIVDLFKAGAEKLGTEPYGETCARVDGAQFSAFKETVEKKGIYKNMSPDSIEYMAVNAKVMAKYLQKKGTPAPKKIQKVSEELMAQAEEKKNLGNTAIQKKNFNAAVRHYSDAIDLVANGETSHIYFSNRAAAHCYLESYEDAVEDCNSAIALNAGYCKAYSRLGLAQYNLKNFQKAVEAYSMCVDLEPEVKSHKDGLMSAKKALNNDKSDTGNGAGAGAGGGLADMLKDPNAMAAAQRMMGGAGGDGGGIASLLKNPQMMKMADEMAKNPQMMQQALSMLGGGGGPGGLDMNAAMQMMGGLGGGPSSSSSSSGQK